VDSPPASGTWHVRFLHPDTRAVCGAGVLLTDRHILTCAHVIGLALGRDPGGPRPDGRVLVDFPASPEPVSRWARVAEGGWARQRQDEGGDLAVLVLDGGPVAGGFPPRLARCGTPGRRNVKVFGHPAGFPGGVWAAAELIGAGGQSSEWVQLDARPAGRPILPGYSGAGVIDEATDAVIGCVVACFVAPERSLQPGVAWMIPLETVARYWPPLGGFLEDLSRPPVAGAPRPEPAADEQQLALALLAVELIRDQRSRDLCVDRLTRRLRQPLPIRRHEGDIDDVRALARGFLTVPGLMAELLAILTQAAGGTPELNELRELAATLIPVPLLERDERNQLYTMLRGARLDGMEVLYREAVGELGKPLRARQGDLATIIQQLEDASYGPHGVPPLLHFLRGVAERLWSPADAALQDWITSVAERLHIAEDRIITPVPVSAEPSADEHYVVTDLTQDLLDPDRYRVTIWFQTGPDSERIIAGGDDELLLLGDVPDQLDKALSNLPPDLIGYGRGRTYEFILPRHLLGHPVDQWRIGPRQMPHRLCMGSPVIVRSQDRLRDQRMQQYWHSKWRWLRAYARSAGPEAVHWLDDQAPVGAEGILSLLVEDDPPVCVVFRQPPSITRDPQHDVAMAALLGGIPVMIWCRDSGNPAPSRNDIELLLADGGLAELPERVRQLRNKAIQLGDPEGHLGLNLTVLWDSADRIPRIYRLHPPPDRRFLS
jgi:hypothetical protein